MFQYARLFTIPPASVANTAQVGVSRIDLYFKSKPAANNTASGIQNPGVIVYIVPTVGGVPDISQLYSAAKCRVEYADVNTSNTGATATQFEFDNPVPVATGVPYAFIFKADGAEIFDLWRARTGDVLVGTSTTDTQYHGGVLYQYNTSAPGANTNSDLLSSPDFATSNNTANTGTVNFTADSWKPLLDTDLKFNLYVARYTVDGNNTLNAFSNSIHTITDDSTLISTNTTTGEVTYRIPARRYEYVTYDRAASSNANVLVGEIVYQNTVFYPGGKANTSSATVSIANGSDVVVISGSYNWNTILPNLGGADPEFLVFTSKDHNGANADVVNVRRVTEIISNTSIRVAQNCTFTNTGAYFFRTPAARVDRFMHGRVFATDQSVVVLVDSTANATMRFANDSITSVAISNGGTGYSNSDYLTFTGFENVASKVLGGYVATANIVTDANGKVTNVYMSNLGSGFTNSSAIAVSVTNSSSLPSTGANLTLTYTTGSLLKSEFLGIASHGGWFANAKIVNLELGGETLGLSLFQPTGTIYTARHRLPYYSVDDAAASSGRVYYCDADGDWDEFDIKTGVTVRPQDLKKRRVLPSWSNEWNIPYAANGSACGARGGSTSGSAPAMTSNASVILTKTFSNSDFASVQIVPDATTVSFVKYQINNSYANEHTNYGNALAKGVEAKFSLANGQIGEDLFVYATARRPAGTDIKMYARLHNSADTEAFDDKDWTLLSLVDGNIYSSATDSNSYIEMTFGIPRSPNTSSTLTGTVTVTNAASNLAGSNTTWSTDLANNDMILLRSPLFPENQRVLLVTSVVSNTVITISEPITNNSMLGSGFVIDKIAYKHQAFRNMGSDNVVRYYSTGMVAYDGFDTIQIKPVLLSNDGIVVPDLDDVRAVVTSS